MCGNVKLLTDNVPTDELLINTQARYLKCFTVLGKNIYFTIYFLYIFSLLLTLIAAMALL